MTRGVVFDMDGVLLDTEGLYTEGTAQVLARFGKSYPFELKLRMMGRSALESAGLLIEELDIPLSVEEYLEERARILKPLFARSKPMPGAEELVRWLYARAVPMAVATSSNRELFRIKTSHHDWFGCFDAMICGDDPRLKNPKPAPDIFLLAAQDLGLNAKDCIAIEDSPAGAEAASRSEMSVIVIPDSRVPLSLLPSDALIVSKLDVSLLRDALSLD